MSDIKALVERLDAMASHRLTSPELSTTLCEAARALTSLSEDAGRLRYEAQRNRAMFDGAIQQLVSIHNLIHADDVVLPDGRRFKFAPPDTLVREAWEGLSRAIRDISIAAKDAALSAGGERE